MRKFWESYKAIILTVLSGLVLVMMGGGLMNRWTRGEGERLKVGEAIVWVEVKATEEEREQGLSGRESLGEDEGVLFVFDQPAKYGFWMKGMLFDLDFVWIQGDKVVEITEGVEAPEGDEGPVKLQPKELVDKVLEVKAGWVERNGIEIGDMVSWQNE